MAITEPYGYFVFSEMQMSQDKLINNNLGRTFRCGEVSVGATKQQYSKIVRSEADLEKMIAMYPDTKLLTEGKLSEINYSEITTNFR